MGHDPEVPREESELSASGDERHDDVGGVPVKVLPAAVVDRGGSRIGVSGGDLHIAQRHASVKAAMMNPARSMCGWTTPSPARLPIERTQR